MFLCHNCDATFMEPNVSKWIEPHGEPWCEWICPECGSADFTEMEECCICGEEFDPDELTNGCCDECFEKMLTEDNLLAFALDDKEAFIEFVAGNKK